MKHLYWLILSSCALACTETRPVSSSEDTTPAMASVADASRALQDAAMEAGDLSCEKIALSANPNSPEILIVQDRSASMVGLGDRRNQGKNRWDPSVSALKKLTSELSSTVAFGLMLFPSTRVPMGKVVGGPGCEPGAVDVAPATGNDEMIAYTLDRARPDVGSTPTSASLMAALEALSAPACADCRVVPKYVLLVTDGQPACGAIGTGSSSPEDIAATNAAIDALKQAGIATYVIGYDTASDPAAAATMDGFAQHGGTERHFPVEDEATLLAELTRIASALVPCEFELSAEITDPAYVRVEVDGVSYQYGRDWTIDGKTIVLTPQGGACVDLRDARFTDLGITRECDPVFVF
jgi:hypothetical protein